MDDDPELSSLQSWAQDALLAKKNLHALLPAIASPSEPSRQWATEALENCGPPLLEDRNWIADQLLSSQQDILYWSCTLLGRLESEARQCAPQLMNLLNRDSVSEPVRNRAIWALKKIGLPTEKHPIPAKA